MLIITRGHVWQLDTRAFAVPTLQGEPSRPRDLLPCNQEPKCLEASSRGPHCGKAHSTALFSQSCLVSRPGAYAMAASVVPHWKSGPQPPFTTRTGASLQRGLLFRGLLCLSKAFFECLYIYVYTHILRDSSEAANANVQRTLKQLSGASFSCVAVLMI